METIWNNKNRVGSFTSSKIGELMTYGKDQKSMGKPALTYVKSKNRERRLMRSIDSESSARPLAWGKILEGGVFALLGLEYSLISHETIQHPTIPFWSGSPDGIKEEDGVRTIIDIKCPLSLNSFCSLVDCIYDGLSGMDAINALIDEHKDGHDFYYQLVSNAILTDSKYAELVVFCPYQDELDMVRELASNYDGDNLHKYYWIANAADNELPYLIRDAFYKNLNIIRFEVPQADKDALTARVLEAGKLLIGVVEEPKKSKPEPPNTLFLDGIVKNLPPVGVPEDKKKAAQAKIKAIKGVKVQKSLE